MANTSQQEFSKLRSFFWPIHKGELAKFLPMGLIMFFILFVEKNKGFARLLSREALSENEQNVSDNVTQFYERFEMVLRQILKEDEKKLITQPGISAQLIVTTLEGNISRYIRSKFKEAPSTYVENIWNLLSISIFKS